MATVWITYAWADNTSRDIDYIAQELEAAGLSVQLDRWNIAAGGRLWEQISTFITDPTESNAWLLVATQNSLQSEPCKEEFAYALDRALNNRGNQFPVIALFLSDVDEALIPAGIRTRLFLSVQDSDWKERVVAAAEGRPHRVARDSVEPYDLHVHTNLPGEKPYAIEVRPRAGTWAPFIAAVPLGEKEAVDPFIMIGPRGVPTNTGQLNNPGSSESDGYWLNVAGNQATPTMSYFIWCRQLPSELLFGVNYNSREQYSVRFDASRATD